MSFFESFVVYVVVWWILFFIFLPIGIKKSSNLISGQDSGAPEKTFLWKKIFVVSLIALALTFIIIYLIDNKIVSIIN